jgi:hypothetical protein
MADHSVLHKMKQYLLWGTMIVALFAVLAYLAKPTPEPKTPPLDYARPIFTSNFNVICPIGALFDIRADHGPEAVSDLFTSVFKLREKEQRLGCEEWRAGIEVKAVRMRPPFDAYVQVNDGLFTVEPDLTNGSGNGNTETETAASFHANAIARDYGAVICPDSAGARSVFHEKEWDETLEDDLRKVQSGVPIKAPDLSPYGCTTLDSGTGIYIEKTDATGIATVTSHRSDGTTLRGITRQDMLLLSK